MHFDSADIANLVADRLRVNKLAFKLHAWVALAVARLNEVPGHLRWPPSFAECAATLAFGDELLVLPDDKYEWRTPGGRDFAAVYLLPRAETALRQELQRLADSANRSAPRRGHRAEGSLLLILASAGVVALAVVASYHNFT
jgi:hypothetical protein